jgi:Lsr2
MARIYMLVDDLTGEQFQPGTDEGTEGVVLSFMGESVKLDLAAASITELRDTLSKYFDSGTEAPALVVEEKQQRRRSPNGTNTGKADREQAQAIRDWARSQGMDVSERGRISQRVMEAYNNHHSQRPPRPTSSTPPRPPLPTAKDLAQIHTVAKQEVKPAPQLEFSAPADTDTDTDDDTGPDLSSNVIEVTTAGINAWMESKGMPTEGVKFLRKLKLYREGHPGKTVKHMASDKKAAS